MPPVRPYSAMVSLLVVALSITRGASPQTGSIGSRTVDAHHQIGRHLKATGVPNFGEVTPTLFRGGQPTAEGFETLAHMGIAIVVDTGRSKRDEKLIKRLGMTYFYLPWYCPIPKDKVFAKFIDIIKQNPGKKVFVHCRLGDDRSGMMIVAYRMAVDHWTAKEAKQEMHEFGYRGIHHLMCPGLGRYEKSFPKRLRKDQVFKNLH